ncbi:MAG: 23S rRNA (pseudouridine(1915)-N(3))-methyltransferase RlmH [bacterium]|nr:23S rRNA (pseudouridine(1915)-N(3))-methyltransferase RlmH [bacterium]
MAIFSVGAPKDQNIKSLIAEYTKRLSPYIQLTTKVIKPEPIKNLNEAERIKETEGNRIIDHLDNQSFNILLTEHGKEFDSIAFAKNLTKWSEQGQKTLTFIIAGPLGVSQSLKDACDLQLSLSPMTFPHELAQAMLYEQLYRAGTILHGKTYHY